MFLRLLKCCKNIFLWDIRIYFYSLKLNFYSIKYIYMILKSKINLYSKFAFIQSKIILYSKTNIFITWLFLIQLKYLCHMNFSIDIFLSDHIWSLFYLVHFYLQKVEFWTVARCCEETGKKDTEYQNIV